MIFRRSSYMFKKYLERSSLKDQMEMVHFGLTSDDINNLAYALMIKGALEEVLLPGNKES